MEIKYYVPSCGRAKTIKTLDYLSKAIALVSDVEYDEYVKYHPQYKDRFMKMPSGIQGNGKSRCLNYMLTHLWGDADYIMHLDDDVTCLMAHRKNEKDREIGEEEFYDICEKTFILANEWGCGMWGVSSNSDPLIYDEFKPFRLHAYIDGAIIGYVKQDELRYDEELTIKEDVDFCLQKMKKYHKCLRVEKYWLKDEAFTNEGGCQWFRTSEEEQRQFKRMQEKWGSQIIRPNKPLAKINSKIRSYGGAIRLNIPLDGA